MMHTRKGILLLVLGTIVLAGLACGGSISTANIRNAILTSDEAGTQQTTVFDQEQIFYCIVDLANAPDDTVVKAVWIATQIEGESPDTTINETEFTSGDATLTFNLSNEYLWPIGQYKVELYLNGELDQTLDFEVR